MDTSSAKTVVKLLAPFDWEQWDNDFKTKAVNLELWGHINPDEEEQPLGKRPTQPLISDFSKSRAVLTPASSTIQSQGSEQQSDGPQPPAESFVDLSGDDQRNYQFLVSTYNQDYRRYQNQLERVHTLTSWIQDTVSPHYRKTCCKPTESLRTWYSKLKSLVQPDEARLEAALLDRYERIVKPMTRPPTNFDAWLRSWLVVMADAQDKDMQFAQRPSMWCRQFMKAIRAVKPTWELMYSATYKPKILDGTLDYHTVANDFQEELNKDKAMKRGPIGKGAFGPTYDGEGDKPSLKPENKNPKSPKKRKRSESENDRCPVCEKSGCRGLEYCRYAFPEQAPEGWKEFDNIRRVAGKNLAKQSVKDKLKAIKTKRAKPDSGRVTELPDD